MPRLVFPRLYAILDVDAAAASGHAPVDILDAWLAAGVRLVQLRAKRLSLGPMLELADQGVSRCQEAHATFIVNDRVDVARLSGASGVHLGQDDLAPDEARLLLEPRQIVGWSTHSMPQVDAALATPADYLAIGPVFATHTKARPDPVVGLDGVAAAARRIEGRVPLVAIGGITLENAAGVLEAGADSVAMIAGLLSGLGAGGPQARAAGVLGCLGR